MPIVYPSLLRMSVPVEGGPTTREYDLSDIEEREENEVSVHRRFLLSVVETSDGGLRISFVETLFSSSSRVVSLRCILVESELFPLSSIVARAPGSVCAVDELLPINSVLLSSHHSSMRSISLGSLVEPCCCCGLSVEDRLAFVC